MAEKSKSFALLILLLLLCIGLFLPVPASAQPEPSSPEEEWYPPEPGVYEINVTRGYFTTVAIGTTTVPSPGSIQIELIDKNGKIRSEFYDNEAFYMRFVSPYNTFYIYLYEWYPPGNVPRGHWLMFAAGPYRMGAGAIVSVGYFQPEQGEPEGQHVWKLWLYDPLSRSWSLGIVRFNYFRFPRAKIEGVDLPQTIYVGQSYSMSVRVRNTGEVDYTYTVEIEGAGLVFATREQSVRVLAGSTATVTFTFNPVSSGALSVTVRVKGDGTVVDSRVVQLAAQVLKPGPMALGDVSPATFREGEEQAVVFTFINRGEGEARSVSARLEAPGFILVKGVDFSPNVPAGGTGRVSFTVRASEGGRKTLRVVVSYADAAGRTYEDVLEAQVLVLVRLKLEARTLKGENLPVQLKVGDEKASSFEKWVDPTVAIHVEAPEMVEGRGVRYVFKAWSDGTASFARDLALVKSASITAMYRVEYYVTAESEYGEVSGAGWYEEGSQATIKVQPSTVGFGVKHVFDHWEDENGHVVSRDPVATVIVNQPIKLRAVWRTDYTDLILLSLAAIAAAIAVMVFARRRARPPPPPPPS
ncbi:MAG: hypothetical protein LM580_08310 [Thermofilum sp.]|jgi:hypothetical protein|nr:hypothetical protein [Thermofilum sp.]